MTDIDIETIETRSLGNATHLLAVGDGEAVVVDPPRDAWRVLAAAEARGWRITHVLETHVHNDYLSGALELRAAVDAEIVAPAAGRYAFRLRGAEDGDVLEVGALRIRATATPGHTPEHLAWEFGRLDRAGGGFADLGGAAPPWAVATGGSLLVGSAGRTDLLGSDRVDELTVAQHRSLGYLAALPPEVRILPTHGTGSFCAAGPASDARTTTVGEERRGNPLLGIGDVDTFRRTMLAGFGAYPDYYREMATINRAGPPVLGRLPAIARLGPSAFEGEIAAGARVVDGRPRDAFAAGHLPDSLNVEVEDDTFAAYVGWHVPFGRSLALVLPDVPGIVERAATELSRIGFDRVVGVLDGGVDAWIASGRAVGSYPTVATSDVPAPAGDGDGASPTLLDVRDPQEWREDGTVPGALAIPLWELRDRLAEVPRDRPVTVLCRSGRRAAIAASILEAAGVDVRVVVRGGVVEIREGR